MSGKGSGRRPCGVSQTVYHDNWERTFVKKAKTVAQLAAELKKAAQITNRTTTREAHS